MREVDLAVLGAGPAGMRAALTAANSGAKVVLLDEQQVAGGQIYREVNRQGVGRGALLGRDYTHGLTWVKEVAASNVEHLAEATGWQIENSGEITFSRGGQAQQIAAKRIVLATGALERAFPFPGWTMPGVISAGAAQILLKGSGIVPQKAVLVGSGPLLYLIAVQLLAAGSPPLAILETQSFESYLRSARLFPAALKGWRYFVKGTQMLLNLKRAGVTRYTGVSEIAAVGEKYVEGIRFQFRGQKKQLACGLILGHQGVVPNVQFSRALGLEHGWNDLQRSFTPRTDHWGRSSEERVFIAGDGAGIVGARASALQGEICALQVLHDLSFINTAQRDNTAESRRKELAVELAPRALLDALYRPPDWAVVPVCDDTIICRCERVKTGDLRNLAAGACVGPNQAKALSRAGMGSCQGRYCGLSVSELFSKTNGRSLAEVGYYRLRSPVKGITLGELASLAVGEALE